MSSSNQNADLIVSLNNASNTLNRYVSIFIFIFGMIGNFLNVLVLSQRTLRKNPSAAFFLASSVAGIIVILSGIISQMLSGYNLDLSLTNKWICKIRNFILFGSRTVLLWMIVLATVDRWLSSSVAANLRSLSNLQNARRSMVVVLIYTCLINAPILYCDEANLTGVLRGCYASTHICRLTTDLIYSFGTILLPLLLMVIFGLLTTRNVHHVQNRVRNVTVLRMSVDIRTTSTITSGQTQGKKTDRQLLKMLLVQVTLLFVFTCPHAAQKVYSSFAPTPPSGSLENAIQSLIFDVLTLFTFIASGMPFYIYTLTGGSIFRNALIHLVKTIVQKILCH
jgi:hypothetical protein